MLSCQYVCSSNTIFSNCRGNIEAKSDFRLSLNPRIKLVRFEKSGAMDVNGKFKGVEELSEIQAVSILEQERR